MNFRTPVKNILRHCGHAIASSVHDRLTVIDRMLQDILDQNTHVAGTQTALLQSGIHVVETLNRLQVGLDQSETRVESLLQEHCASKAEIQAVGTALQEMRGDAVTTAALQDLADQLAQMRGDAAGKTDLQSLGRQLCVVQDILEQNVHIADTQTALLQSGVHLVDSLTRLQTEMQQFEARIVAQVRMHCAARTEVESLATALAGVHTETSELGEQIGQIRETAAQKSEWQTIEARLQEMDQRLRDTLEASTESLRSVKEQIEKTQSAEGTIIQSGIDRILNLSADMQNTATHSLTVLQPVAYETKSFLENQSVRQVCIETSDYISTNPELGLFSFLYSYLPSRIVLDIGAHIGDVSAHLLNVGYEVYAFEPYLKSYDRLKKRLGARPDFHAFNLALGSVTGEAPMYLVKDTSADHKYEDTTVFHSLAQHGMPAELAFSGSTSVPIRRLSDLHRDGLVPADAGLVKIDTEGYDLEVVRGMGEYHYPVVTVEFWDAQIPFATQGLLYTVENIVYEMRQRGYLWYIVIYRVWGQNETAFFCNHDRPVPNSWGNIVFFRDRQTFLEGQNWCSAALPRTYFKHVATQPQELLLQTAAGAVKR